MQKAGQESGHTKGESGVAVAGPQSSAPRHNPPIRSSFLINLLRNGESISDFMKDAWHIIIKFSTFVGPGFMISVAYIDPGNYATDVAAGSTFRFRLLFVVLMSNLFAIFLQSLAVKLGTVTGKNLAEHCRDNLPKWLNIILYILAESAIIATDIAEVIGSAIALNLLAKIPIVAGCALTIVDVILILILYNPNGSMKGLRVFEIFVATLVTGVVICFCIQLSLTKGATVKEVFAGYLPSTAIVQSKGLFQACGILGATVMPHSLYLGTGIVQPRLLEFDTKHKLLPAPEGGVDDPDDARSRYKPSLAAIKACLPYSIAEIVISLFTFALFVNSAILIVAGASLSNNAAAPDADLFGIHDLLSTSLAPVAGTIFALALLLSGTSAGIVCTIAGQMVSEGQLKWSVSPWMRRLVTRTISIVPSIIIAAAVGREGLSAALNGTQVALSVILPFVTAPLIYFTCRHRYMTVPAESVVSLRPTNEKIDTDANPDQEAGRVGKVGPVQMGNGWVTSIAGMVVWAIITLMNVALLVLVGKGLV